MGVQARSEGEFVRELSTTGFFSMAWPWIWVNGSCDLTVAGKLYDKPPFDAWVEHLYHLDDGRVPADEFVGAALFALRMKRRVRTDGGYMVRKQLAAHDVLDEDQSPGTSPSLAIALSLPPQKVSPLPPPPLRVCVVQATVPELMAALNSDDRSVPRKIISFAANLPDSDAYWRRQKVFVDWLAKFHMIEYGDHLTTFQSGSYAENYQPHAHALLREYATLTRARRTGETREQVQRRFDSDWAFRKQLLNECAHLLTLYFDSRTVNFWCTGACHLHTRPRRCLCLLLIPATLSALQTFSRHFLVPSGDFLLRDTDDCLAPRSRIISPSLVPCGRSHTRGLPPKRQLHQVRVGADERLHPFSWHDVWGRALRNHQAERGLGKAAPRPGAGGDHRT